LRLVIDQQGNFGGVGTVEVSPVKWRFCPYTCTNKPSTDAPIKENIPALIFKSGRFISTFTHEILTARLPSFALALAYVTAKATLYVNRLKTKTPGQEDPAGRPKEDRCEITS
jgi:hypothetical protein